MTFARRFHQFSNKITAIASIVVGSSFILFGVLFVLFTAIPEMGYVKTAGQIVRYERISAPGTTDQEYVAIVRFRTREGQTMETQASHLTGSPSKMALPEDINLWYSPSNPNNVLQGNPSLIYAFGGILALMGVGLIVFGRAMSK